MEPHIFGLVSGVLRSMQADSRDQTISISGESGSGKTETNKHCLRFIAYLSQKQAQQNNSNVQSKILNCNPILQAFGNAKTLKNDNSSRFGKLITLGIDTQDFSVHNATIKHYFLEKTRIVTQSAGESNFHVFYYLLRGISPNDAQRYHLIDKKSKGVVMHPQKFRYLSTSGSQQSDSQDKINKDKQFFDQLKGALGTLGVPEDSVWRVVSGVLHLGNVGFDPTTYSEGVAACDFQDPEDFTKACSLLGLEAPVLEKAMLYFKRKVGNEETLNPEPPAKCEQSRDSLAKFLYQGLFQELIKTMNNTLDKLQSTRKVSSLSQLNKLRILDIYGFQVFQSNGFEQFCVNYTNQRLHQISIKHIFKQEKEVFQREELEKVLANIHFSDNARIIDMIDLDVRSILNLLDETCTVNTKDQDFLNKIKKGYGQGSKPHQAFPIANKSMTRKAFIIKHTPCEIEYTVSGFKERNKDILRDELLRVLSTSTNEIVKAICATKETNHGKKYMSVKLRSEVNKLMQQLEDNCELHFVRCIKPNQRKQPFTFVPKTCLNQIRYLGLLDTILLRRATYHVRMPYAQFCKHYGLLSWRQHDPEALTTATSEESKDKAVKLYKENFGSANIDSHFGKTLLFLRQGSKAYIDKIYSNKLQKFQVQANLIRSYLQGMRIAKQSEKKITAYRSKKVIQKYIMPWRKLIMQRKAAKVFERVWLKNRDKYFLKKRRKPTKVVQGYFLRLLDSIRLQQYYRSGRILQTYSRSMLLAQHFKKLQRVRRIVKWDVVDMIWNKSKQYKLKTIQSYITGYLTRKNNSQKIVAAQKSTRKILALKYTKSINSKLKGSVQARSTQRKFRAIQMIQSTFRMIAFWKRYRELRDRTVTIQRAWRRHRFNKTEGLRFLEDFYFRDQALRDETKRRARQLLFRPISLASRNNPSPIEAILKEMEHVKHPRIGLFYYMLDFEPITSIESIYPNFSWLENYVHLFKEGLNKGNPVQYIQVGESHTLVSTATRLYSWGMNDYYQLGTNNLTADPSSIHTVAIPQAAVVKSFSAFGNYSSVSFSEPPSVHYFGEIHPDLEIKNNNFANTVNCQYIVHSGVVLEMRKTSFRQIAFSQKVVQLSCGVGHTICRTGNKRVFSWGDNDQGQLGHGDRKSRTTPTALAFFDNKKDSTILQVSAGYRCSVMLSSTHAILWCGTNATINEVTTPQPVELETKSNYLWNHAKYTPVRISCSWSKSIGLVGVTFAMHNGSTASPQIKNKILQQLASKWVQDSSSGGGTSILPPYNSNLAHHLTEKVMKLPIFRQSAEMESRKKLKELRASIATQLRSVKFVELQHLQGQSDY